MICITNFNELLVLNAYPYRKHKQMMDSVNVMKRIIEGKKRTDHEVDSEVDFDDILRKSSSEEIFLHLS